MIIDATARFQLGVGYQIDVILTGSQRSVTTQSPDLARVRERVLAAAITAEPSARSADITVRSLVVERPDVGPDGLTVRVLSTPGDTGEQAVDTASADGLGRAEWWPVEGAWLVAQPGTETGFVPSERLDFAPALTAEDRKRFDEALAAMDRGALERRRQRSRSALDALLPNIAERVSEATAQYPGSVLRVGLPYVIVGVLEPRDLDKIAAAGVKVLLYARTDVAIDDVAIEPVSAD